MCPYTKHFDCKELFETQKDASHHALLTHDVHMFHIAENGEFLCPFSQSGCRETFPSRGVRNHIEAAHFGDRVPCPFKEKLDCQLTFKTCGPVRRHVNNAHKKLKVPCTWADTTNCKAIFTRKETMVAHVKAVHEGQAIACILADKLNCQSTFTTERDMRTHVRVLHKRGYIPCPYAEVEQCKTKFWGKQGLDIHVKAVHEKETFPCPYAIEAQCSKTFTSKSHAKNHVERKHEEKRFVCPMAEVKKCTAVFASRDSAYRHVRQQRPFLCFRRGCLHRFETREEATRHANNPKHPSTLWKCPLPSCLAAVAGRRLTKRRKAPHENAHKRRGEIPPNFKYVPIEADELRVESATSLFSAILEHERLKGARGIAKSKFSRDNADEELSSIVEESLSADAEWESFDDEQEEEDGEDKGQGEDEEEREEMEAIINKMMGDDEENDFATECLGEQANPIIQKGLLYMEQRTRIHERNYVKWGMLGPKHPLTYF